MSTPDSYNHEIPRRNAVKHSSTKSTALARSSTEFLWLTAFALLAVVLAVATFFRGDLAASQIDYSPEPHQHGTNFRAVVISPDVLPPISSSRNMDWVIGGAALFFAGLVIFLTFILLMFLRWRGINDVENNLLTTVVLQGLYRLDPKYWFLVLGLYGFGGPYMMYQGIQVIARGLLSPQQRRSPLLLSV
jgi:hypothetical protein